MAALSRDPVKRGAVCFSHSLKNPTLVRPPPVEAMMSFNTLTPHYEEDVIYALSAADTARQLGLVGPDAHKVSRWCRHLTSRSPNTQHVCPSDMSLWSKTRSSASLSEVMADKER